ncbi:MAG TPA: hypothetical protein VND15_02760 [Candidatus Acidoferrales bacterium]|nr:hypothetical protein [Candidatus Acidoferrales bacterium]
MDTSVALTNGKIPLRTHEKELPLGLLRTPAEMLDHFKSWTSLNGTQRKAAIESYFKERNQVYLSKILVENTGQKSGMTDAELDKTRYCIDDRELAKAMHSELANKGFVEIYKPPSPFISVMPDGLKPKLNILSMVPQSSFPSLLIFPMLGRMEIGKHYVYNYLRETELVEYLMAKAESTYPDAYAAIKGDFRNVQSLHGIPEFLKSLWKPAQTKQ